MIKWIDTTNEKNRIYHFSERSVNFRDVIRIEIRPSGKHRLELKDGKKILFPLIGSGWKSKLMNGLVK